MLYNLIYRGRCFYMSNPFRNYTLRMTDVRRSDNDMKFRGRISYRAMRIIASFFVLLSSIGTILMVYESLLDTETQKSQIEVLENITTIFTVLSFSAMPLMILSKFYLVIRNRESFRSMILKFLALTLTFYAIFLIVYFHFGMTLINVLYEGPSLQEKMALLDSIIKSVFSSFLSFNLFIDIFLCTLTAFFFTYRPKKYFQGKKLIIFRCFAALPIIYDLASMTLRGLDKAAIVNVPAVILPLFSVKPPLLFIIFLSLIAYVKIRERIYIKKGGTHEGYNEYMKSNHASFHFALFTSISLLIASAIDIILLYTLYKGVDLEAPETPTYIIFLNTMGVGRLAYGFIVVPFVFFSNYNIYHKNQMIDSLLPVVFFGLTIITFIEGFFQIFLRLMR